MISTSIDRIIQEDPNPFDSETFWSGNFWQEAPDPHLTVESIHQETIAQIRQLIDDIASDRRSRTILLEGETGSGKTYLLGRIKRLLNSKAFFTYIEPFTASDYIWRHILRYTVDSLLEVSEGQTDSQLLLWLKGLSGFKQRGLFDWWRGEKHRFVDRLIEDYPTGIYNDREFFGVLYNLTDARLSKLACEWLRGDDLDDENLSKLGVRSSIDTEDAAQKILANFGRISIETQPIVLCFDQLDNIARLEDGSIDLPALFRVNSAIHNQKLKNFLVIISIITDTWRQNSHRILATDADRIDALLKLKQISLDEAEALWASRLYLLHHKTYPQPTSPIYPLMRQHLEERFPGGKTRPRNTLILGRRLFQESKIKVLQADLDSQGDRNGKPALELIPEANVNAAFKLVWMKKLKQVGERLKSIRDYSAPELIQMLAEVLAALQISNIQLRLLPSRVYASYSLSYEDKNSDRVGVVWSEDKNLVKFCNLIKACQDAFSFNRCTRLQLIRAEGVGSSNNQGYKLYSQLFSRESTNNHFMPDLDSVRYLVTYHSLVNDVLAGELTVGDRTPNLKELQTFIRDSEILKECVLLQQLELLGEPMSQDSRETPLKSIEEFLVNCVVNQQCIALKRLVQETVDRFDNIDETETSKLIRKLCQGDSKMQILNPNVDESEQLVYLVKE